ncbi:hypothetical protein JXA12_00345 [Candidatus Woesearchaeota archaeon]|nr:hypothetical protein [Candidatus Woesearchaeota archaeon]
MKRLVMLMLGTVLACTLVLAAGEGQAGQNGTQNNIPNDKPAQADAPVMTQEQVQARVQSIEQEALQLQQRLQAQQAGEDEQTQAMLQHQHQVRVAAQTLAHLANMTGGIGENISGIARHFNNSVQATMQAEERIQSKGGFARFFTGGDKEAGEALQAEVNQNRVQLQQLQQLHDDCECDEAVKTMLQEQLQLMQEEQNRLQELAEKEQRKKGLLGWIWK